MGEEIKVTGLKELEQMLLGISDRLAKNIMFGAMRAGVVVVQKEAKLRCPVSAEVHWLGKKGGKSRVLIQPGELKRKGIKVRKVTKKQGALRSIAYAAYCSKKYWYAPFVERGHLLKSKGGQAIGHVAAKPFMRPAWDASREKMLEAARAYLQRRIPEELARGK